MLRCAWDNGDLPGLDMRQHLTATATHTSLIAHITQRELAHNLSRTEAHNGFANRCLWAWVERSQCLPDGGNLAPADLSHLAREFRAAVDWAVATLEILFRRDAMAGELWRRSLSLHKPALARHAWRRHQPRRGPGSPA
jgi:hypothetical protein